MSSTKNEGVQLYEFILKHYPEMRDVQELCFYLDVNADDLRGATRRDKARYLVEHLRNRGRVADLRAILNQQHGEAYQSTFGSKPANVISKPEPTRSSSQIARNPRQVFVSHATADAEFAHKLANDLNAAGFDIWIAPESIPDGQWVSAINRGLAESGVMLLVLTPEASASPWVEMETNIAIELERAGQMRFIPICLQRAQYPPMWHAYQWELFDEDYSTAFSQLVMKLGGYSEKASKEIEVWKGQSAVISQYQVAQIDELVKTVAKALGVKTGKNEVAAVYREVYRKFQLTNHRQLPAESFDDAMQYLRIWLEVIETGFADFQERIIHPKTGIELIRIPVGPFQYGETGKTTTKELPEFWIGRFPVTNAQYKRFLDAKKDQPVPFVDADWTKPYNWDRQTRNYPDGKANHPVVLVSWEDATAFCVWAGLHLPTEQEWEKAARGDKDDRPWPWGSDWVDGRCNTSEAGIGTTTPVGLYSPQGDSPYSCADMVGNVWELTATFAFDDMRPVLSGGSWGTNLRMAPVGSHISYFHLYYPLPPRGIMSLGAATVDQLHNKLEEAIARVEAGWTPRRALPSTADILANERLVIDFGDREELLDRLQKALKVMGFDTPQAWKALEAQGIFRGSGRPQGKLAFLFPGQGSQYVLPKIKGLDIGFRVAARDVSGF